MEIINQIVDGIYQVRLPLPFALSSVNCYLLRDTTGWTVLDAGLNYEPSREAWQHAFAALGIGWGDIQRIVLTHTHPDHYGAAGWLAAQSGALVFASAVEQRFAQINWQSTGTYDRLLIDGFQRHGTPAALLQEVASDMAALRQKTAPHPAMQTLDAGRLDIGSRRFQLLFTPGHSDGHTVLYCADEQLMLCGDTVLMKITPNIGVWPLCHPNPLAMFLHSLQQLAQFDVALALPGHGPLITSFRQRAAELHAHHHERLARAHAAIGGSATAWHVCTSLFSTQRLSSHQLRFAMAETLAHLEYLVADGRATRDDAALIQYHSL